MSGYTTGTPMEFDDLPLVTLIAAVEHIPDHGSTPSRRLYAALLQDAIRDAREASEAGELARDWIASDDADDLFAFVHVADVLGLSVDAIRCHVQQHAPSKLHQAALFAFAPAPDNRPDIGGCSVCGWAATPTGELCSDPREHNPSCVRRGKDRGRFRCRLCRSHHDVEFVTRHCLRRTLGVIEAWLCADCRVRTRSRLRAGKPPLREQRAYADVIDTMRKLDTPRLGDVASALGWSRNRASFWMRRLSALGEVVRVDYGQYRLAEAAR